MITPKVLRDALRHLMVAHGTLDATTRPCGTPLPTPHAHALLELMSSASAPGITTLAATLGMERTTCSRMCKRMVDDGELQRIADPCDGRAQLLELTPKGLALARRVDMASTAHFARILAHIPEERADEILTSLAHLTHVISTLTPEEP